MNSHEIYQALSPEIVARMLDWFREHERAVYTNSVTTLAKNRKLRPVFIQRKPLPQQYAWIQKTCGLKACDTIGEHMLQAWFLAGHQPLLAAFCDAMGIPHDGKGSVQGDLPESLDGAKLDTAVDALLESNDPRLITLYLLVFNLQVPDGWPSLTAKLESDGRLKLA